MSRNIFTAVIFLLLGIVNFPAFQGNQTRGNISDEEYSVYNAVFREMFAGDKVMFDLGGSKIKRLVIGDETSWEHGYPADSSGWKSLRSGSPQLTQEIIDNYFVQNKTAANLENKFDLKLEIVLIKKSEIDEVRKAYDVKAWENFYKKYPDSKGLIRLSRVGFNNTKDRALVYFQHACGNLCGSGHYLLLTKGQDGWKLDFKRMIWIS